MDEITLRQCSLSESITIDMMKKMANFGHMVPFIGVKLIVQ